MIQNPAQPVPVIQNPAQPTYGAPAPMPPPQMAPQMAPQPNAYGAPMGGAPLGSAPLGGETMDQGGYPGAQGAQGSRAGKGGKGGQKTMYSVDGWLKWIFVVMHCIFIVAYFLTWCHSGLTFSGFMTGLGYIFICLMFLFAHLELRFMSPILAQAPCLENGWASVAAGIFFVLQYPYVLSGYAVFLVGSIFTFVGLVADVFLLIFGIIRACAE